MSKICEIKPLSELCKKAIEGATEKDSCGGCPSVNGGDTKCVSVHQNAGPKKPKAENLIAAARHTKSKVRSPAYAPPKASFGFVT